MEYLHPAGGVVGGRHSPRAEPRAERRLPANRVLDSAKPVKQQIEADMVAQGRIRRFETVPHREVHNLTETVYSDAGSQVLEARTYTNVIDNSGSFTGGSASSYDATVYKYDDMGRQRRIKSPDGTITLASFDVLGRTTTREVGTNDADEAGTDNMVIGEELQYDGGSAGGNSHLTRRRAHLDGSGTNYRETVYAYDYRGRLLLTTSPLAPHTLAKYDNMHRMVAVAQYTSAPGATQDPLSHATNRSALSQTFYDEQGRVYRTQRHSIDQSDGSDDDNLQSLSWYDAEGRVIKTKGEGSIAKTLYDRLGRATNRFVIANDGGETSYTDMGGVAGDTVVEEHQTYFQDTTGLALMQVTISRYHDDTSTTGALDTDTDLSLLDWTNSKIKGRAAITTTFYDWLGRVTDTVARGTNAASNYDRDSDSTPPARSDTLLRTTYVYNDSGTLLQVEDPRSLKTRWVYDDAGRRIAEIRNYVNGVPSSATGDDDVHTRFTYANGHMTEMWVDLNGNGTKDSDDQVTTYTYGVSKGSGYPDSSIAHGGMLRQVTYPAHDPMGSPTRNDVVDYAYDATGALVWVKDQTGTEIETVYDALGRTLHRRVIAIHNSLDDTVRRISTTYLSRGLVDTVTQYTNAGVGSGTATDQVQYSYDGWGNLTKFDQDVDGVIGAGGRAAFAVEHAWTKRTPTGGAPVLARASTTLPGTGWNTITYGYGTSGSIADTLSRVDTLRDGATARVSYQYVGAGQVVHSHLEEPDVGMVAYDPDGTPRDYAYLDRFNRVIRSKWTGDSIHDVTLTYDRNSNIMTQDDALFTRSDEKGFFDAAYTMDGLNRLINTREGHMISGSISTGNRAREEGWPTLSQTGNWELHTLDLNGDGDLLDPGELNRTATFNRANEILTYDNDGNSGTTIDLHITAHNARGDLTSLATGASPSQSLGRTFTYDAFGRLTRVSLGATTIANYRYNGLGFRIMAQYDLDADETLEDDERRYFCSDERWRVVAAFKNSSTHPKERYVHHAAGLRGLGGSSYIDSVVLRDRDTTVPWTGSSPSGDTLGERLYYAQNWRADVVALIGTDADVKEWVKYSSYGVPHSIPKGDYDLDGDVDAADTDALDLMIAGAGGWNLDFNRDGNLDQDDVDAHAAYRTAYSGGTGGRGVQSRSAIDNTLGYAGYHWDAVATLNHVRHRVYLPSLGRWTRRDPAGYVDGMSVYEYVRGQSVVGVDPNGLAMNACTNRVDWCWNNDPVVIRLKNLDCGIKRKSISCENCAPQFPPGETPGGFYRCSTNTITICADTLNTTAEYCQVLAHELVHACDNHEWRKEGECVIGTRCHLRACSEIRAAALSGQCCNGSRWRRPGDTYESCVRRSAKASTRYGCNADIVDYQWAQCYSTIPPGELPPCAASA